MGASLQSRLILATAFLLLSLVLWEARVAWDRYEPLSGYLGGFRSTPAGFQVREPGRAPDAEGFEGPGPLVPAHEFYGARYDVATPFLLAPLLGSEPRLRMTALLGPPDVSGSLRVDPWGGGRDPLGEFLWITRPLMGWLVRLDFKDVKAKATDRSLVLIPAGKDLELQAGDP